MSTSNAEIGRLMRLQMVALGYAVDDVEADRYTPQEREHLAGGLDTLAAALRESSDAAPRIIEAQS